MKQLPLDWSTYQTTLSETGFALLPSRLSASECQELASMFDEAGLYRKAIVMQNHGYGSGEYKYFNYPLPPVVDAIRHELFANIASVANGWNEKLGIALRYPNDLDEWLATCHAAGQTRPTPLILKYGAGDWNALHQDMAICTSRFRRFCF